MLQHLKPEKECYVAAPCSPKRSVGLQHPKRCNTLKPDKECWLATPYALRGMLSCNTLSPRRRVGLHNPELVSNSTFFLPQHARMAVLTDTSHPTKKRNEKKLHTFTNPAKCRQSDCTQHFERKSSRNSKKRQRLPLLMRGQGQKMVKDC